MLLEELHIQCSLFERAIVHLEDAADHWIKMTRGEDFDRKVPPLDILNWCIACLASMSAIRHLLLAGRKDRVADHRRAALREFLGNPDLTNVGSATVRDSWEHLDERLDRILPVLTSGSISSVYVAATPPAPGTLALKRFDPVEFAIHFTGDSIALRPAVAEIAALNEKVDAAVKLLSVKLVFPWPADVARPLHPPGA